jgi:hypothetical protein
MGMPGMTAGSSNALSVTPSSGNAPGSKNCVKLMLFIRQKINNKLEIGYNEFLISVGDICCCKKQRTTI